MKGLAHLGVLLALEEHGFLPREVVGSSVGSLITVVWCAGMPIDEVKSMALELKRPDLFRIAHRDMALKRMRSPAIYRREPLEHLIDGLLGDLTFDNLERRLIVNTVDINSGMQVFWGTPGLTDVRVADAVYASLALPGFLPPREIRGRFLADGASVANFPVGIARSYHRDLVIAVDVGSSGALRAEVQDSGFAAVYARAIEIGIDKMRDAALERWSSPPLVLLQPRVEHLSMFTFEQNRWLIDEGYRVTDELLRRPGGIPVPDAIGVYPRRRVTLSVVRERCIGCGACLAWGPRGLFTLDDEGKAVVTEPEQIWSPADGGMVRHCPTYAIVARADAWDQGPRDGEGNFDRQTST